MKSRRLFSLAFALSCALPSLAQNYAPKTMVFTGAISYKDKDLIAVTGLTPGK